MMYYVPKRETNVCVLYHINTLKILTMYGRLSFFRLLEAIHLKYRITLISKKSFSAATADYFTREFIYFDESLSVVLVVLLD